MRTLKQLYRLPILVLALLLGACTDKHDHPANLTGEQLYNLHCSGCHKETGKGKFLKGVPPSRFTGLSTKELMDKIRRGGNSKTKMKIFDNMSREEAELIAIYVKQELFRK